jgi:hypothetical protein
MKICNFNYFNFDVNARRVVFSIVCLLLLFTVSTSAISARYELKKGRQYELCRDYVDALNAMKRKLPMACGRHFPPEFEKFSKPKWTPLDPKEQPNSFYRQMYLVIYQKEITEKGWTWFWKDRIQPALESDSAELAKARIDIDHNGVVETVFRFRFTGCEVRKAWFRDGILFRDGKGLGPEGFQYYVLNEKTGELDPRYGGHTLDSGGGGALSGLFYYQGRVYIDKANILPSTFSHPPKPDGYLKVFEPASRVDSTSHLRFGSRQVCTVKVFYEMDSAVVGE